MFLCVCVCVYVRVCVRVCERVCGVFALQNYCIIVVLSFLQFFPIIWAVAIIQVEMMVTNVL